MQTFSQYLQSLGGASTKQTSLHSTMDNENIAGLYKQQQSDDQFKVGSPSGSVYWTAGVLHAEAQYWASHADLLPLTSSKHPRAVH